MKQAQNMSLEQIVKIVVILAFLLLIVLVFPTKLYGAGKEIIDKAGKLFGFGKKTPIEDSSLRSHLKETVGAMNKCKYNGIVEADKDEESSNLLCHCDIPFSLQNDDYGIEFTGNIARVVDKEGKAMPGLEESVDNVVCMFDIERDIITDRVKVYPRDGDYPMVLRYKEVSGPNWGIESYFPSVRRASITMSGKTYGVSMKMFRWGDRYLCFVTDAYVAFQNTQGNPLSNKPLCG